MTFESMAIVLIFFPAYVYVLGYAFTRGVYKARWLYHQQVMKELDHNLKPMED